MSHYMPKCKVIRAERNLGQVKMGAIPCVAMEALRRPQAIDSSEAYISGSMPRPALPAFPLRQVRGKGLRCAVPRLTRKVKGGDDLRPCEGSRSSPAHDARTLNVAPIRHHARHATQGIFHA